MRKRYVKCAELVSQWSGTGETRRGQKGFGATGKETRTLVGQQQQLRTRTRLRLRCQSALFERATLVGPCRTNQSRACSYCAPHSRTAEAQDARGKEGRARTDVRLAVGAVVDDVLTAVAEQRNQAAGPHAAKKRRTSSKFDSNARVRIRGLSPEYCNLQYVQYTTEHEQIE